MTRRWDVVSLKEAGRLTKSKNNRGFTTLSTTGCFLLLINTSFQTQDNIVSGMYLERVKSCEGCFQSRNSFSQVTLTLFLQCLRLRSLLIGYSFILPYQFTASFYFGRLFFNYLLNVIQITTIIPRHNSLVVSKVTIL